MSTYQDIIETCTKQSDSQRAKHSQRFFKTGKGEYAEGDVFLGVNVPQQRAIAKEFRSRLSESDVLRLLQSKYHEHRLIALFILVDWFEKGDDQQQEHIYNLYLHYIKCVNNWDLVDSSAHKIVGMHIWNTSNGQALNDLFRLAHAENLWERRIAMIATAAFITNGYFDPTIQLAHTLINDSHDLIHKAVGWMLREVGKKDELVLLNFLDLHAGVMPRTMLRYSIERLSKEQRNAYLKK